MARVSEVSNGISAILGEMRKRQAEGKEISPAQIMNLANGIGELKDIYGIAVSNLFLIGKETDAMWDSSVYPKFEDFIIEYDQSQISFNELTEILTNFVEVLKLNAEVLQEYEMSKSKLEPLLERTIRRL